MPIYVGSRYEDAIIDRVLGPDGVMHPTAFQTLRATALSGTDSYLVIDGDRLDQIAYAVYGRPDLWWIIALANPDLMLPDPLVPGTTLRIPRARSSA